MKELIDIMIATSKDRLANPIVGTFIFSWLAFNWKPILFLVISNQPIESKILYIDANFSSIYNLLLFPFIAVIVYALLIPYINLGVEYLLEFSRIKRNIISISKQKQFIENKKELAIEEIKLEEAQTEFRERKSQNKLIEDLQKSLLDKDEQLNIERERFNELNTKIKEESSYLNKRFHQDRKDFESKMNSLLEENNMLRKNLFETDKNIKTESNTKEKIRIIEENGKVFRINSLGEKFLIRERSENERKMNNNL